MKKLFTLLFVAAMAITSQAAMYIVGQNPPFNGWSYNSGIEMTAGDNGVYTYTFTYNAVSSGSNADAYFVFANGFASSWNAFHSTNRIGPTNGNVDVTVGVQTTTQFAGGDNGAYKVTLSGGESYTITFNQNEMWFKVEGEIKEETNATYVVAGTESMMGEGWNTTSTINQMTKGDDGKYTLTKTDVTLTAGTKYEYKVVKNGSTWYGDQNNSDNNYEFTVEENGTYTIVFTFDPDTKVCTHTLTKTSTETVDNTYTVAGTEAMMGSGWEPTDTNNDLVKQEDGTYTLTKSSVTLTAGELYEYKVVVNHSWNLNYGKDGVENGGNDTVVVTETAIYDITFTFNEETHICTYTLTKVGEVTPEEVNVWIIGDNTGWDPTVGLPMIKEDEEGVYTYTFAPADAGDGYGYFSFTKKLASTNDGNGWAEINAYRFGHGVTDGDFEVTKDLYYTHIAKGEDGTSYALKVAANTDIIVIVNLNESWIEIDTIPVETLEAYVLTATTEPSLDPTSVTLMPYDEEAGYFLASGVNIANVYQGSGYFGITTKQGETIEEIASYMLGFESNGYEVTNFVGSSFDEATGVAVTPAVSNAAKVAAGVYDIYMYVQEATAIAPKRVNLLAEEASWYVKVVSTGETGVSDLTNVSSIDNVKYYNMAGVESNEPMDGVNIRVITFTDGSKATDKVIR